MMILFFIFVITIGFGEAVFFLRFLVVILVAVIIVAQINKDFLVRILGRLLFPRGQDAFRATCQHCLYYAFVFDRRRCGCCSVHGNVMCGLFDMSIFRVPHHLCERGADKINKTDNSM